MTGCEVIFDIAALKQEKEQINLDLSSAAVWQSPQKMQELQKRKAYIENVLSPFEAIFSKAAYLEDSIKILAEDGGELLLPEIQQEIKNLSEAVAELELQHFLSEPMDKNNAILIIHPGAGGTESQDWAQMLLRMYLRWAERHKFEAQVVDLLPGEEAGIKSATITLTGLFAYGYLKAEVGVHRLVRISPYDSNKRRHTSFAAVLVYPEIEEEINVAIRPEDIRIDTFRASGAGGQHVNKTSSAVRITHLPTGIIVACQNDRSQHKNKATAFKILKARIYDRLLQEQEDKIKGVVGSKKDIAWGSQIRSYVLQPYTLVKDHRTSVETGNVNAVMDGNIDGFIKAYLEWRKTRN